MSDLIVPLCPDAPRVISGGNGRNNITGGDGNDTITGGQGADLALLGNGDDVFVWNPGDASDVDAARGIETYFLNFAPNPEAEAIAVRVIPPGDIDRNGLHKSNLRGLRAALWACQPADVSLVENATPGLARLG